jgi:ribosomal protein S27E
MPHPQAIFCPSCGKPIGTLKGGQLKTNVGTYTTISASGSVNIWCGACGASKRWETRPARATA